MVESPMTKLPPVGSWLMIMFDGPAVMVALNGSAEVLCCSSAGLSSQPVAEISTTGEHPLQGRVALKFGSVIS